MIDAMHTFASGTKSSYHLTTSRLHRIGLDQGIVIYPCSIGPPSPQQPTKYSLLGPYSQVIFPNLARPKKTTRSYIELAYFHNRKYPKVSKVRCKIFQSSSLPQSTSKQARLGPFNISNVQLSEWLKCLHTIQNYKYTRRFLNC